MRITVFGANGRIGREVIKYALKKGYEVVAYMRPNRFLDDEHPQLFCVNGELDDFAKMKEALSGSDAVVCALGGFFQDAIPVAFQNVVKVLEEVGPKRFICLMTPTVWISEDIKGFFYKTIWYCHYRTILFFRHGRKNIKQCGATVINSKLDWTIVRYLAPVDGEYTGNVKVGYDVKLEITRPDVAAFMVDQVEDPTYIRKLPVVGS